MSAPLCKWLSLCETHQHKLVQLSGISRAAQRRQAAKGTYRKEKNVKRTKEKDSKQALKEERSVWSPAIIVSSHLSWVIVLPVNQR